MDKLQLEKLYTQLTNRIPPFVIQTSFSFVISVLVFYGHIEIAFKFGSIVWSLYQMINVLFEIFTEKIVITTSDNSWRSKFVALDRTIVKNRLTRENKISDLESQPLTGQCDEYSYKVRIPSILHNNANVLTYLNKYCFIPLFTLGIIKEQYVYQQDLIEFVRKNL